VEAQIESAAGRQNLTRSRELPPEQIEILRAKENLELSRTRITRELESSANPRYQVILRKALLDVDQKLADLEPAKKAVVAAAH